MKMTLKLKPVCGQISWAGKMLTSSTMERSEGRESHGVRQGQMAHWTLGQVKHEDLYPVDTHYVQHYESSV